MTPFGEDPLAGHDDLKIIRQRVMDETLPTPQDLFSNVVNGIDLPFAMAIQFMVDKTTTLSS